MHGCKLNGVLRLLKRGTITSPAAQSHYKHPSVYSLNRGGYYQACGRSSSSSTPEMSLFPPVWSRPPVICCEPQWQAITLHLQRPRARQQFGIGVAVTSFVNHDSLYSALMQHRWRIGACPRLSLKYRRVTGSLPMWGDSVSACYKLQNVWR